MASKKTYWNIDRLWETGAQYLMPLGQRANGKSYQGRRKGYEINLDNNEKFIYLRRWKDDIKASEVENWFNMSQLKKYYPKADGVICWQYKIYTYHMNEKGMKEKDEWIGWYLALNEAERYKSWEQIYESGARLIIFEEFITDKVYLDDEPDKLQQLVSTCFRHEKGRVLLIGNTISQICPYFEYWSLTGVLTQKQGTIEIYHQHQEDGTVVDIAVENCNSINYENKMFFGQTAKQIISGEWETSAYPSRPKGEWETLYEVAVHYQLFKFILQLQINEDDHLIVFVYPSDREVDRILSDKFSTHPLISKKLFIDNKAEQMMTDLWRRNKFCYSDNLTGTNFNKLVDNYLFMN